MVTLTWTLLVLVCLLASFVAIAAWKAGVVVKIPGGTRTLAWGAAVLILVIISILTIRSWSGGSGDGSKKEVVIRVEGPKIGSVDVSPLYFRGFVVPEGLAYSTPDPPEPMRIRKIYEDGSVEAGTDGPSPDDDPVWSKKDVKKVEFLSLGEPFVLDVEWRRCDKRDNSRRPCY